jgi:hypothetical protein
MKKDGLRAICIPKKEISKMGFNPKYFSYYVTITYRENNELITLQNCKAVEDFEDGEETLYFSEGNDSILLIKASDNPKAIIKKIFLN